MTAEIRREQNLHPEGLTSIQERLASALFNIGAIKFGNFDIRVHKDFPDAPKSPIYIDIRMLRRFPEEKKLALLVYKDLLKPLHFDVLADVPTAATPIVSSLADKFGIGMVTPRADKKQYGSGVEVDGKIENDAGRTVAVIDDLITDGGSKIEAVNTLRRAGYIVNDVVVLIDREQGGREELQSEENKLHLHAAMTMSQILDYYVRGPKRINASERQAIQERLDLLNKFSFEHKKMQA